VDYYQGVVIEYLRATRSRFVNTECLIQLVPGDTPERGLHWYCDAVTIDLKEQEIYLCEISYSQTLSALFKRLETWRTHWDALRSELARDCSVDATWPVRPWIFVPRARKDLLEKKLLSRSANFSTMPTPHITFLEDIAPWLYRSWNGMEYAASEKAAIRTQ
jgi:hypothetical protein